MMLEYNALITGTMCLYFECNYILPKLLLKLFAQNLFQPNMFVQYQVLFHFSYHQIMKFSMGISVILFDSYCKVSYT